MKSEKTVLFGEPIPLPSDRDAVEYRFPFTVIDSSLIGKPEEKSETGHHRIQVTITGTLAASWGFGEDYRDPDLVKVLFEFGKRHITEKVKDGTLSDKEQLVLSTSNQPEVQCPFEPSKIQKISGAIIKVPIPNKGLMQTLREDQLAASIIDRRDSINALFDEQHGEKLLLLTQERNLLDFFHEATSQADFSNQVASLGNIVVSLNVKILRKITGIIDTRVKSISLLEAYLKTISDNYENVISVFRNLNRIRQAYPVHQDNAEVIRGYKFFQIPYPVEDYNNAWTVLLDRYLSALEGLLEIVKKETK